LWRQLLTHQDSAKHEEKDKKMANIAIGQSKRNFILLVISFSTDSLQGAAPAAVG